MGLDHGPTRDSHDVGSVAVELGNEPPMSVDGGRRKDLDRRRVSVRWLAGTILTGLSGAALMGGAVFAALDGETHLAATPERVELRNPVAARVPSHKGDRLAPVNEVTSARQVIRTTSMTRIGEREVPRIKPLFACPAISR